VPIDTADAAGETALMRSVEGDHPDTAALLVRRGADLERKNRLGMSARDMAEAKGDDRLNRALGIHADRPPR
jgi:ankyrin repeat protein